MINSNYSDFIIAYFPAFLVGIGVFAFAVNYVLTEKILFIAVKRRLFTP